MTTSSVAPGPKALHILWPLLALATALAAYLGWTHVELTHGTGAFESLCQIGEGFDCDSVNTSEWSELRGMPISLFALPLYAVMALLTFTGLGAGERAARARGGLLVLSSFALAVSLALLAVMAIQLQTWCLFCLTLDALHLGIWLVVLSTTRRPALPGPMDVLGGFVATVFVTVFAFQFAVIYGDKLDRVALAEVRGEDVVVAETDVAVEKRDGRVVTLPGKRWDVPTDRFDPAVGPKRAKVVVVEFADFECGYCRRLGHALSPLKERYKDRVRFVYKHFPMDTACNTLMKKQHHPDACAAARASICAHRQGAFWPLHDRMFKNQTHLSGADLVAHAEAVGLDIPRWTACLDEPQVAAELEEDISHGAYLELTGTPRTYVNGLMFKGAVSESLLEAAILAELGELERSEDGRVRTQREIAVDAPLPAGPVDMVEIAGEGGSYWIDAVENSLDVNGRAIPLAGAVPPNVTWHQATAACAGAGKRLCTAAEWMGACQGAPAVDDDESGSVLDDYLEGRLYPYADRYREGFCHDTGDRDKHRAIAAGGRGACRTPEGAYDMAGNLQEWVGSDPSDALLLGGAWFYKDKAACGTSYDTFGAGMSNRTTGFRCCADTPVKTPLTPEGDIALPVTPSLAPDEATGGSEAVLAREGEPAPDFSGPLLGGGRFDAASVEGEVVLVNFWASWCTPCRKEMPALIALQNDLADQGFQVVAVNVDRESARAKAFLKGAEIPFPVVLDPDSSVVGRFDVVAMPTTVLIDQQGRVVTVHAGYNETWFAELRGRIEAMLAEG